MNVSRFDQAADFLQTAVHYLEAQESLNSLMLGLAVRLSQKPPRRRNRPFFAVVQEKDILLAAALMTPPRKLILYSHLPNCLPALEALWSDIEQSRWTVPGVLGPANAADAWAEIWSEKNGRSPKPGMRQRVHKLEKVQPLSLPPGELRAAGADDFERCVDWLMAFHRDAHLQDELEAAELLVRQKIQNRDLYLWIDEAGEPVSMAAKVRPTKKGVSVSLVYTPEALRGRGFATACVATLSQALLDEGFHFCSLFTDLSNPVSNHIYEKIGYTAVADFHEYIFS